MSVLGAHDDAVHGLTWVDPNLVLTGCEDGVLLAHDTRTAGIQWRMKLEHGICCLRSVLSAPGKVVVGCTKGYLAVLDTSSRRTLLLERLHNDDVRAVAVAEQSFRGTDGSRMHTALLSTSFDTTGRVLRLNASLDSISTVARLAGHTDKVLCAKFTPLGQPVTTGADGKVLLWHP